jgi:hypothetical protein
MRARRLIRVALSALVVPAGLLCFSASALAAAPETGKAEPITADSATLHGVLNPGAAGEVGSYQFSYAQSGTECTPGTLDPSSPVFAKGLEGEAVSVTLTGLEPDKEYAFCVIAYNLAAQPSDGAVVPFKTLALPPAVDSESASVTSTSAILEAQINSENQETGYSFEYSTSSTLAGAITVVGNMLSAFDGDQGASVSTSTLQPNTTYYYRVLAKNISGEEEVGAIKSFTTVAVPHTKPVSAVTATSATFNGELTPLNATVAAEYFFEYHIGGECTGGAGTTPASAGSETVSTPVSGLQPGVSYAVCLVSSNGFGSEVDPATPVVSFTTPPAAPKVDGEGPASVTPFEGAFEAQINPNGLETSYSFEYSTTESLLGKLTGTITTLNGTTPLTGAGDQTVSVPTGHVLASGTTYHFRVIAKNALGESEGAGELTTATAEKPIVESESTPFLNATGVTLQAQVNPNYQATTYTFEYATEAALLGTPGATQVPGGSIPAGIGGQSASARVSEALTPGTTYYYQVIAKNETGTTTGLSTVEHFTTPIPPEASTGGVEGVTFGAATVSGTVNPEGQETFYSIQYGATTGYGQSTTPTDAGAETTSVATGPIHLNTLTPGTIYHYRLVATNYSGETTVGADATFTTAPAPLMPSEAEQTPIAPTPIGAAPVGSTFPNLTAIAPIPGPKEAPETTSTAKSLTKAQKLAKALKACKEKTKGANRMKCERQARAKYGKTTKKKGR